MNKIDFKKELKHLYSPSLKTVMVVDVPPLNFLMIDGQGDPNTTIAYKEAVEALFSLSYALKFMVKKELALDYAVMPLEGLWWVEDMSQLSLNDRSVWQWTAMIMQPEYIVADLIEVARHQVAGWKKLPALPRLRLETFHEGQSGRPNPASWPLRRRGANHRATAPIHHRAGQATHGQASRNLPE